MAARWMTALVEPPMAWRTRPPPPVTRPEAAAVGAGPQHLALVAAGEHGPRGEGHRGDPRACRAHEEGREGLVAASQEDHRVQRLRPYHGLRVHGEEVPH